MMTSGAKREATSTISEVMTFLNENICIDLLQNDIYSLMYNFIFHQNLKYLPFFQHTWNGKMYNWLSSSTEIKEISKLLRVRVSVLLQKITMKIYTVSNAHKMIPPAPPCFVWQSPCFALGNPKIIRIKT